MFELASAAEVRRAARSAAQAARPRAPPKTTIDSLLAHTCVELRHKKGHHVSADLRARPKACATVHRIPLHHRLESLLCRRVHADDV